MTLAAGPFISGTVLGVNGHVVMGEVAGPDTLFDRSAPEIPAGGDILLIHHRLPTLFSVVFRTATVTNQADIAEIDFNGIKVQPLNTGAAYRSQDAPPVGVRGKQRGFHQRRMGYRVSHIQGFLLGG